MKSSFHDASARQRSGGPSPVLGRASDRNSRTRNTDIAEVERQIAGTAATIWIALNLE
jgi:hypothetical protein